MEHSETDKLQRILDYQLNLDSPGEHSATERLLGEDVEAQRLAAALEKALGPLGALADETPPLGLALRTVRYVNDHEQARHLARASAALAAGSRRDSGEAGGAVRWFIGNVRDLIAVAACLALVVMVSQPGLRQARSISQRNVCASQMRQVGVGLAQYASDNAGFLPYVSNKPGAKWWNVGAKGSENTSNTRSYFLLVKKGYVPAGVFRCSSKPVRRRLLISAEMLETMHDFAGRDEVNYSFQLMFGRPMRLESSGRRIIMSDQNPVFAEFDPTKEIDLGANSILQRENSPNHGRRGQNVLYRDGSVSFIRSRRLRRDDDDIFTIRATVKYRGNEIPASDDDTFIAP